MMIHHFLEKSADKRPEKEAVVHGKRRLTYLQTERSANRVANWLLESGLEKGDRVAILLRNSVEYIFSYYGALKAGGIATPLNTGLDPSEIMEMLMNSRAKVLITEKFFSKVLNRAAVWDLPILYSMIDMETPPVDPIKGEYIPFTRVISHFSPQRPKIDLKETDISSIIYSSGSTGKPKGVALTHANVVANTRSIVSYLELTEKDRCMSILPFYYVYGKSLLNTHFAVSGTVIIDNRFTFPNAVLKNMIEEKATGFSGVPSSYAILLKRSSMKKMAFPKLRYLTQAGGHMPKNLKKQLLGIFPDKKIFIMYGATEASARLSYLPPERLGDKMDSIGKAIPGVTMKVFTNEGEEAPPNHEGEIAARGENIMKSYWNSPEETAKVLKDGWYYTGDLGLMDEEGFFYVTGRKRDMIKVGIYKVSAKEIEETLYKYPGIFEVAVVGVPHDTLGEAVAAFVAPDPGHNPDPKDIISFCKKHLPPYKAPESIHLLKNLPKNQAGKILKKRLPIIADESK